MKLPWKISWFICKQRGGSANATRSPIDHTSNAAASHNPGKNVERDVEVQEHNAEANEKTVRKPIRMRDP